MGKMKPRTLGDAEVEAKDKAKQKEKAMEKKASSVAKAKENKSAGKEPASAKASAGKEKASKKPVVKKVRGTKYAKAKKLVDVTKKYSLVDALALLKKMKYVAFDESVDLHFIVDKSGLKGEIDLPHSTGKMVKVAIVSDVVLAELEAGKINFDILITHPSYMSKLAKFAKVLGPKGLMPNPKAGTISATPEAVAKKFEKGMLRWKTEAKFPLIHQMVGKVSFEDKKLVENIQAFITAVGRAHIIEAYLTATMTPSVKIDLEKI